MADKNLNLYQRMLRVSTDVMNVEKNMTVGAGTKGSYKAVADYDVVVAIKLAEARYGVISVPVSQELVDTQVMSYTDSYGNQKTQFVDIVKVTMQIFNTDNPADSITVNAFGRGIDPADKGFGKASTYARKYCLLNAYKIATGEDPDKDASQQVKMTKGAQQAPAAKKTMTAKMRGQLIGKIQKATTPQELEEIKKQAFEKLTITEEEWNNVVLEAGWQVMDAGWKFPEDN